ncbi:hypothetical protein [Candidatus Methylobacter oryzae]|uniref:carboxymuconolactone decarboxylase family protein n=1 Tax=Candidatus Methylobacter oryzae TaxID=2497749 RepID=UPI0019D68ACC
MMSSQKRYPQLNTIRRNNVAYCAYGLRLNALNVAGIVETMVQAVVYTGFPAALNGLFAAKDVFAEHDA